MFPGRETGLQDGMKPLRSEHAGRPGCPPIDLAAYQLHHNGHRPHQARDQLPPAAHEKPATVHDLDTRKVLRTRITGGLINEYDGYTA